MPLHLYRRHRLGCAGGHPSDAHTGELDEHRKGWRRCDCRIYVSGTLAGRFNRLNTHHHTWPGAHTAADALSAAGAWPRPAPVAPAPDTPPIALPALLPAWPPASVPASVTTATGIRPLLRTPIETVIASFLSARAAAGVAANSLKKYRTHVKKIRAFAAAKGYAYVDEIRPDDIDAFFVSLALGKRSKAKFLEWLRQFFRHAVNRDWITRSPVSPDLRPPKGALRPPNRWPFTDAELTATIAACDALGTQTWANATAAGTWTPDDAKDMVWLLTYTGLRISDAVLFDMARLDGQAVWLRASKNGGDVFGHLPPWLVTRLHARARRYGATPFRLGRATNLNATIETWRRRIARVFKLAILDRAHTPTLHRFRHTFIRILLQQGVSTADVATLTGDEEKTIRLHYARWVPERQARLTQILRSAFRRKPRPAAKARPRSRVQGPAARRARSGPPPPRPRQARK